MTAVKYFISFVFLLLPLSVSADTIVIDNNQTITGEIISEDDMFITIRDKDEIKKINKRFIKSITQNTDISSETPPSQNINKTEKTLPPKLEREFLLPPPPRKNTLRTIEQTKERTYSLILYPGISMVLSGIEEINNEKPGGAGFGIGFQILKSESSNTQYGIDINYQNFGNNEFYYSGADWKIESNALIISAIGKLNLLGKQESLNIFGGLGFASCYGKLYVDPAPGYVWPDTLTAEERTEDKRTFGASLILGGEISFNRNDNLYILGVKYLSTNIDLESEYIDEFTLNSLFFYFGTSFNLL